MKSFFNFFKTKLGCFGIFSLVLIVLEDILDDNFFCPCKHYGYNHAICAFYASVPALGCFFGALCFMDLSPETQDEVLDCKSICKLQRVVPSFLCALTWLCLFFLDGRYLACAYSNWESVYAKSDTSWIMHWCKPTGNNTLVLEKQQRTLELMAISQFTGFTLMAVVIVSMAILRCCKPELLGDTTAKKQTPQEGILLLQTQAATKAQTTSL
ncbi:hypothetical protein Q7C36_022977 [Tachysurus vachellii]|uniref:Uncharacterized protein n=1 Tax=Tachysurus vachellii TaxID=175792 RepID=A0AA88LL44_TACVA|nr:uncharacterized protein LOC132841363 [Tachysurus vachellii]KAK2816706.1 hypothetical protein Q7C36_022977 [Tachysurus vachellii]